MINEAPTEPLHPSKFLPKWERNFEDEPEQQDSCDNLPKSGQSTPSTKRKRKQTEPKSETQKLDTTEKPKTEGYKMRFLVGTDNGKITPLLPYQRKKLIANFNIPERTK